MELISQVNTFVGGMNLDDDVTMLSKNQYRLANNVRLVTNDSGTTGALQNIEYIRQYPGGLDESEQIIGTTVAKRYNHITQKVEESGIVVTIKDDINNIWAVTEFNTNSPKWYLIVSAKLNLKEKLSIVSNFESDKISKLYITDGESNIKMINISKEYDITKPIMNEYYFDTIPEAILFPVELNSLTNGMLPSGSVQYCFQLFTERGAESAISPIGNIIPLSKYLKNGESKTILGQIKGESSELGCVLKVKFNNTGEFNRLRMIRVHYEDNTSLPTITVINEIPIVAEKGFNSISYTDNGASFLNVLTIDEFAALVPYDFNAKTLATLHNRLFAANVKENTWDVEYDARAYRCDKRGDVLLLSSTGDNISFNLQSVSNRDIPKEHDCINPYNILSENPGTKYIYRPDGFMGGTGKNISYRFIFTELVLSSTATNTGKASNDLYLNASAANKKEIKLVYEDGTTAANQTITSDNSLIHNYSNAHICSKYLGYMRDEIYRFGIVFYNNKGIPSPVHWIGDIRMPSTKDASSKDSVLYPFHTGVHSSAYDRTVEQLAYAMGIEFTVNNIPDEVVSWEIVRCDRTEADRTIVSQGIISSLMQFDSWEGDGSAGEFSFGENDIRPMPIINLGKKFYTRFIFTNGEVEQHKSFSRMENYYEFISPEVAVSKNSILPSIQNSKLNCLYKVSTYNDLFGNQTDSAGGSSKTIKQLGYKQSTVSVVWSDEQQENDKYFGGIIMIGGTRGQLYFHSGQGAFTQQKDWFEKQVLFKYYNVEHDIDTTEFQIKDAIIGASLPYQNDLSDSKNYAQPIGSKMYTNTSIGGIHQYGNHGINCVLQLDESFVKTSGTNGTIDQVFNYLNTSYITNIKRNIIPYGGNNYSSRQNSIYISCGAHNSSTDTKVVCYGGDTYLNVFDYLNTSFCQKNNDSEEWKRMRMNTVCYIPLESVVNTNLFSSESYHNSVVGTTGDNLIQNEPIVLGNGYVQQKPLYEYNTAYSVQSEALKYIPKYMYSIDDLNNQTRITCSELKTNNEIIDSWTKFKFANYLDVDSQYGQVTNLKVFKNKLYFFQDSSVGVASVNDRSLITDNNPGELTLGTGGILVRYDYILTQNGDSIVNDKSITNSENTIYWYDFDKNVLCALSQNGFLELSKAKKVQTYLNNLEERTNAVSFVDKKYNEVWFKLYDKCLIYNENIQAFTSFYTHDPNWFFPFSTKTVTMVDNKCYYLHDLYSLDNNSKEDRESCVKFVVNDNIAYTKVFDNQWFAADISDECLKEIVFNTKTQETEPIDYTNIENREDNYRFAIGREKQNNPAQQTQTNASYAGRMRGKYLICNYTFDCNNNREFKLPYIKTTYRYSML